MALLQADSALPRGLASLRSSSTNWTAWLGRNVDLAVPSFVLCVIALACFLWPLVYSIPSPIAENLNLVEVAPLSAHHLLGTNALGEDVLSRLLYGGRVSFEVGCGANAIGLLVGGTIGVVAGFLGGLVETVAMRVLDMLLAFPSLMLAMIVAAYLGPGEVHTIWAISFFSVPAFARLARASTIRLKEEVFVLASSLCGAGRARVMLRHIAANVVPPLLTFSLLGVAIAIIVEASLSFLGLGVPLPMPSWGNMISVGETYLESDPYLVLIPSAFLFVTIMSLNMAGDALRSRLGGE